MSGGHVSEPDPHWPTYSRSPRLRGNPASSIALAASSIGYSTRFQRADHVSVSSSSHAARGSPSRGWPTLPRIDQPLALGQVELGAALHLPAVDVAVGAGEPQRHVCVADGADPGLHGVDAQVGLSRGQHVLPHRVARAGVVEADRLSVSLGLEPAQKARACPCPRARESTALRRPHGGRSLRCRSRPARPGRGCPPGRGRSAPGPAPRTRRAGRRSPRDRRETTRRRARGPTSSSTARNAGRLPCTSESTAILRRSPSLLSGAMGDHRSRLPLTIVVAVVAAGVATVILRPKSGLIDPATVDVTAYFSAAELDRASDFRDLQRVLGLAGVALSGGTLAVLALRPPRAVRRLLERLESRPVRGGAAVGAGLALTLTVVGLPLAVWRHERAVDVGLSTQSLAPWLGDLAKSTAIEMVFAAIGGAVAIALIRRFPRNWWLPGAAIAVGFAVLTLYLSPIVIDPLFNRFEPLPKGELRSDVLRLADRAGVDVGEVYRVDASRRTTAINAYVGGLGHTKRVVLYDNLIEDFPEDQVRSVVAHELGHVKGRDVGRGLLWVAIVAPPGMLAVQRLERVDRPHRARPVRPGVAAGGGVLAGSGQFGPDLRGQRAVAAGGGAGGRLRARADPRPQCLHRPRAQPGATQRQRPRSAQRPAGAVRHPPDDRRADRDRRGVSGGSGRPSAGGRRRGARRCRRTRGGS